MNENGRQDGEMSKINALHRATRIFLTQGIGYSLFLTLVGRPVKFLVHFRQKQQFDGAISAL